MRQSIIYVLLLTGKLCGPAHADFFVTPTSAEPPQPQTSGTDTSSWSPVSHGRPTARRPQPSRTPHALGFGNQVPLSFAVQQIVPKVVTVTYVRGVDPDALVTWQGGGPWDRVLAAAVRPIGFQIGMAYGGMSVVIRK